MIMKKMDVDKMGMEMSSKRHGLDEYGIPEMIPRGDEKRRLWTPRRIPPASSGEHQSSRGGGSTSERGLQLVLGFLSPHTALKCFSNLPSHICLFLSKTTYIHTHNYKIKSQHIYFD